MKISIILSTANRSRALEETLKTIEILRIPPEIEGELLVIDNASKDETKKVVESFNPANLEVRYVFERRVGKCYALNTGIKEANGDVLFFLDDDVRPPSNWIEGMIEPILYRNATAVVGGVRIAPHLKREWMTKLTSSLMGSTEYQDPEKPFIIGGNLAIKKDVFEKVPGFDVELGPGALGCYEDVLFSEQIYCAGFNVQSAFNIIAEHHFDESRLKHKSLLQHAKKKGESLAYLRYHWSHKEVRVTLLDFIKDYLRLLKWRFIRRKDCKRNEGIADWEMTLVSHIHLRKQFSKELKRRRNYEKFGLNKIYSND